jgi:hypothetical protein
MRAVNSIQTVMVMIRRMVTSCGSRLSLKQTDKDSYANIYPGVLPLTRENIESPAPIKNYNFCLRIFHLQKIIKIPYEFLT